MDTGRISPKSFVGDLIARWPQIAPVFIRHRMSCVGCEMSGFETLEDAAKIYHLPLSNLIDEIHQVIDNNSLTANDEE